MRKNSLEGTPLGEYAKAQEENTEKEAKAKEGIQTEQTDKGTKISGLAPKEDPFEDIGYRRT